jgi:GT2 family glycosyltransferase
MVAHRQPHFSIVIPTFRRPDALRECVASLLAVDYPSEAFELIVVDDEGEGRAAPALAGIDRGDVAVRLESQRQRGAAAARNRGATVARGEILLFVDDDIIVGPDHLQRHAAAQQLGGDRPLVNGAWRFTPAVQAVLEQTAFGRFRLALEEEFQSAAMGTEIADGIVNMPMLGSWNLSLGRQLFWTIGGFDEDYPVAGAEDQDFSLRARRAGCGLWLDTKIVCLHNDNRLDLEAYCAREERSAQTMPVIARKFPDEFGSSAYVVENRPVRVNDPPGLILKKLIKALLAADAVIRLLHLAVAFAERHGAPERALGRSYRALLGLHLYRGFRRAWS